MIAWWPHDAFNWWLLQPGATHFLGATTLAEAAWRHEPIDLHPTPADWVDAGGRGVCVVLWDRNLLAYFQGVPAINCRGARLVEAVEDHFRLWTPPLVDVQEACHG